MSEKKEPLSFSLTEAEIGNACRAAIVARLHDEELAKAPFKAEVGLKGNEYGSGLRATVTFWPKRIRKARERKT